MKKLFLLSASFLIICSCSTDKTDNALYAKIDSLEKDIKQLEQKSDSSFYELKDITKTQTKDIIYEIHNKSDNMTESPD